MKSNIFKISSLPTNVSVVNYPGIDKDKAHDFFNKRTVCSWSENKLYFIAKTEDINDHSRSVETIQFSEVPQDVKHRLINKLFELSLINKGLYVARKTIFAPREDGLHPLKVDNRRHGTDDVFIHDAIKYSVESIAGDLSVTTIPIFVLTKGNSRIDDAFTSLHAPTLLATKKYPEYQAAMSRWIEFFGDYVGVSYEGYGEFGIDLSSNFVEESKLSFLPEPRVSFHQSGDLAAVWPWDGLKRYHPLDYNLGENKQVINVALIGTGLSFDLLKKINTGIGSYPSFKNVFKSELAMGKERTFFLDRDELKNCQTMQQAKTLYMQALQKLLDAHVDFDVLVVELPEELSHLFIDQDTDFRDFLKVAFLDRKIPTQIITPKAVVSTDSYKYADLALGIYVSAGGKPWKLERQPTSTSFIGISFGVRKTPIGSEILVGVAEIFDEYGESVSIRCVNEVFTAEKGYHLSTEKFQGLIELLLNDYFKEYKEFPQNVVVHKTSDFNDEEIKSLEGLKKIPVNFNFVYVSTSSIRLWPDVMMPKRGDLLTLDQNNGILYTDGYVMSARMYLGLGYPKPLSINIAHGTIPLSEVAEQVLQLTKLNWNSTKNHEKKPVTLSHSAKIVDLLRAGLEYSEVVSDIRYYI